MEEVPARRKPGRPVGKRRRTTWDAVQRRSTALSRSGPLTAVARDREVNNCTYAYVVAAAAQESVEMVHEPEAESSPEESRLELFAKAFWATNYDQLFEVEIAENERLCGSAA